MFSQNRHQQQQTGRFAPTKHAMPMEAQGGGASAGSSSSSSQDKFWKMVNVASSALFKVADVQNPNDVNEVAVKLLGLFQNIKGEYTKRRSLEESRKQSIREMQSNPLHVAPIFNRSTIPPPLSVPAPPLPTQVPTPVPATYAPIQAPQIQAPGLPPIVLPMKQEDVKNMSQEQAQALLGNLLTQLMKEQQQQQQQQRR